MSPKRALDKLDSLMGPVAARELVAKTMRETALRDLEAPDDLLRFAEALIAQGGVIEAVGRSIKIQAILHGAQDAPRR